MLQYYNNNKGVKSSTALPAGQDNPEPVLSLGQEWATIPAGLDNVILFFITLEIFIFDY